MPSDQKQPAPLAIVYGRYSSDHQRDASIEDQIEVCRRWRAPITSPSRRWPGAKRCYSSVSRARRRTRARRCQRPLPASELQPRSLPS